MPPPDTFELIAAYKGTGKATETQTGSITDVRYDIRRYYRMGWVGDDEPRVRMRQEIRGIVRKPNDKYWTHRVLGRNFTLQFQTGEIMHLVVMDIAGNIGNTDNRGIYKPS